MSNDEAEKTRPAVPTLRSAEPATERYLPSAGEPDQKAVRDTTAIASEGATTDAAARPPSREGLEGIDPAIADALKAPKNRHTVLGFEESVLDFLRSDEEALLFSLSLSGYQRLLAHRTAQYHGLQTATVDDGGEDHGKIRATKPQAQLEAKARLADFKVPDPPEEPREQSKGGKKKGDRQLRRDRDAGADAFRSAAYFRSAQEQDYLRARERALSGGGAHEGHYPGFVLPPMAAGNPGVANSPHESGRQRSLSGSLDTELRRRAHPATSQESVGGQGRYANRADAAAAQMMAGMSLHQGDQAALAHAGVAMPGYAPLQVPVAYVPGVGAVPQAVSSIPGVGMGMYGSPPVAYGGYGMPMPYPYFAARPGQQPVVSPMVGQALAPGMVPYYPGFVPQGYQIPGWPGPMAMPQQAAPPFMSRQGSVPSVHGAQSPLGLGHRRVSAPAFTPHTRVDSGFSSSSTVRQAGGSVESSESVSGEARSPPRQHHH